MIARIFSRALFAVRPGFVPSCATACSYTQSRKPRMSCRRSSSIEIGIRISSLLGSQMRLELE